MARLIGRGVLAVTVQGAGVGLRGGVVAGLDQAGDHDDRQDADDDAQAGRGGHLRDPVVDVDVGPVQDQLDADEGEDEASPADR